MSSSCKNKWKRPPPQHRVTKFEATRILHERALQLTNPKTSQPYVTLSPFATNIELSPMMIALAEYRSGKLECQITTKN